MADEPAQEHDPPEHAPTGSDEPAADGDNEPDPDTDTDTDADPGPAAATSPFGRDDELDWPPPPERTAVQARATDAATGAGRVTANAANVHILGELRVYYDGGTTVALPMDGDAGMRIVGAWRHNELQMWEDRIEVTTAPADVSWVGLSLEGVLAMLWIPGLPRAAQPQRMTVDPATV